MYILVHPFFDRQIQVKYSRTELVNTPGEVQHPIVRVALQKFQLDGIDINSIADVPAGTGLGSSSAFTVGLLHALYTYTGKVASKEALAQEACQIEIDTLKEPIGRQDQYAAAWGGLNLMVFHPDDTVQVKPLIVSRTHREQLEENLLVFYLGGKRPARDILSDQVDNIQHDKERFACLVQMTCLADQLGRSLSTGAIDDMGPILDENWQLKKQLSNNISADWIDEYYDQAKRAGATGGKVLGAGGGGFLLIYCPKDCQDKLRRALAGLREMKLGFDSSGSQILWYEENAVW